jgi:plasmid maintenance system antidote protein VapI
MAERTKKLLSELQTWCNREYGRRSEAARVLGVSPQAVTNWFAGRQELTGEQALALHEFLGEARRSEAFFWGICDDQ